LRIFSLSHALLYNIQFLETKKYNHK